MSEPSDQTRRWSTPPSSLSYPRGEWRNVSDGSRGRGGSSAPLWVQRAGYLFLTLCLVAVIGWMIFLLFDRPERTKIVAIGMSTYSEPAIPPNQFGLEDTNRFLELAGSKNDVSILRDKLTGNAINQIPNEISLDGYQNLVVFVNLHAVVLMDQEGGKLQLHFLAVDAVPNSLSAGTGTALVSVKTFLKKFLQKSSVDNILLLADTGRTGVNWRLGIFDNNASDQLNEEVKELTDELKKEFPEKSLPNLHVICSTGSHEVSWMWPKKKQSVFAYYVIEGLKGEADGEGDQLKDERVSCKELFDYVKNRVQNWSRTNRNAIQTVQRFGAGNDFDIFPVQKKQDSRAVEEKEKRQSVGESSQGDKSQGSHKNAKASKSDDQKQTKEKDKNSKPATPQDHAKQQLKRLATFWKHRDVLRKEGEAALHSPHVWRALQSNLVRAERLLRDGSSSEELNSEATKRLVAAENDLRIINDRFEDFRKNSHDYDALKQISVAYQLLVKQNETGEQHNPESTDQKMEQPDISKLVADVLQSTPEKSDVANKRLIDVLQANTSAEGEIARQTIEQTLQCLNTSDRQKLRAVHRLLTLFRKNGRENASRNNQGPAELLLIEQLTDPQFLKDNPSDEILPLSARAITLRQKLEKLIAENSDEVSLLQPGLGRALRAVTTGELWLLEASAVQAGDPDLTKARESFETAEELANALQDDVKKIRRVALLRAKLLAELPDYARWTADRMEAASAPLPRNLSGSLASLAPIQSQVEFLDVFAGKILKLMADLRRLESQLVIAMTEVGKNGPVPIALTRLSDQVSKSWETLQSDFTKEVHELLDEESVTSSTWPLIDSILRVPWIDAVDRSLLQEKLKRKLTPLGARNSDSRSVPGGWQAFWAIQTLALSGKNVDGLWQHWNRWISESTSSELSQREKQAILGQEINKLFTEIRRDVYSTSRSNSSNPHARELLVRLADGWDYPQNLRDDPLVAIHMNRFRELMELRRKDWFLHRNRFHSLAQKYAEICRRLGSQLPGAETMPSVELITPELSFPSGRSDNLTLRIDHFTNQSEVNSTQPRWKLLFLSSHANIFAEGGAASEFTSDDIEQGGERAYRVELHDAEERQSKLTIALVRIEGKEEFPVSIKHVTLIPPSDFSKWKVEFLAADERQRMDRRNQSSFTSNGRDDRDNSTTFGLPPLVGDDPQFYELIPYLTFPGGLSGGRVNVQAYLRSDQKRTVIAEANDVLLLPETGTNRVKLIFQQGGHANPKGNSANPVQPVDISGGLVFEIFQEGKTPIRHAVFPDIWPARQYIVAPELQPGRTRFSISLKRKRPQDSDPLFSSKTPLKATLHLPKSLKILSPDYVQTIDIPVSQSSPITVNFVPRNLTTIKRGDSFPILLSVSGWPYAFRWKLEYDGNSFFEPKEQDELKIVVVYNESPEKKAIRLDGTYLLNQVQPVQFLLLPDSKLFDQSGRRVPWNVKWEIGVRDQNFPVGRSTLFSFHDEKIELKTIEAGRWQFTSEVNNHIFNHTLNNPGRFRIRANVTRENRELDPAFFSVVVDDSPPRAEDIEVTVNQNVRNNGFTLSGKPLKIDVKALDRESGISKIEAGLDLNQDGKLGKDEVTTDPVLIDNLLANVDSSSQRSYPIVIPTSDLPRDQAISLRVLVQVTNGLNQLSEPKRSGKINFKPQSGSVFAKVLGKPFNRELIWILKRPDGSEMVKKKKSRVSQISIQNLSPGKYTVILRDTKGKVRGKSGEFQVVPGENIVLPPIKFR